MAMTFCHGPFERSAEAELSVLMDLSGHAGAAGELPVVPDPSFGDEAERHQSFAIVEADAARHGAVDVAECA